MPLLEPVPLIWTAIEQTRMLRLMYHGKQRILEPHDHGILNGSVQLLGYQIAGKSSRRLPNWLLMKTRDYQARNAGPDLPRRPANCNWQSHQLGQAVHPSETRWGRTQTGSA
jgi:hypothetical protein